MEIEQNKFLSKTFTDSTNLVILTCGICLIVSCLVLCGWAFDINILRSFVPGSTPMNPLTALCFAGTSVSIFIHQFAPRGRIVMNLILSAVVTCCLWVGVSYILNSDIRPDTWFFRDKLDVGTLKSRMAPNTITCFVFLCIAITILDIQRDLAVKISQILMYAICIVCCLVFFGYALETGTGKSFGYELPMALFTAINFCLLAVAIFSFRRSEGFLYPFYGSTQSAKFSRKMLLTSMFLPPLVTTTRLVGENLGFYSSILGSFLGSVVSIVAFGLVIWRGAFVLKKSEESREKMNEGLLARARELELARQEAERANLAKSEFLSRMSHELRTPMNAVLGYAQLIDMKTRDDETRSGAQSIIRGGQHLLRLINEILDTAKIEAGKLDIFVEELSINEVINQSLDLVRTSAENSGVSLNFESHSNGDYFVEADRQRLIQVILNVLSNAIKFNHPGGNVFLRTEAMGESEVSVYISDTGRGMGEGFSGKDFEPFERFGSPDVDGTGLGLALSCELMTLMAGDLRVYESSESGTTMLLTLRRSNGDMSILKEPLVTATDPLNLVVSRTMQVVYIEDNDANIKLLSKMVALIGGIELLSVTNAKEGLSLVTLKHPDVILLDLNLPDLHGSEVLQQLQSNPECASIPVIVISADATDSQRKNLQSLGAFGYLTKPLEITLLKQELERVSRHLGI